MNKMPAQLHRTNASANSITRRRFVALAAGSATVALASDLSGPRPGSGCDQDRAHSAADGTIGRLRHSRARRGHHRGGRNQCRWRLDRRRWQEVSDRDERRRHGQRPQAGHHAVSPVRHGPAGDRRPRPDQLGRLRAAGAGRRTDQAALDRQRLGRADQGVESLRLPGQSGRPPWRCRSCCRRSSPRKASRSLP